MRLRALAIPFILFLTLSLVGAALGAASSINDGLTSSPMTEGEGELNTTGDITPVSKVISSWKETPPPAGSPWARHPYWAQAGSPAQAGPSAGPDVGVWMWNTPGYARPGGVYVYGVEYRNQGDETAENVSIVDTLPAQVEYLGDTSGLAHTLGSGTITWDIASLAPGQGGTFMLTVSVPPDAGTGPGEIESSSIQIATTTPGDTNPDNDSASAGPVDIWEDEVEVGIEQGPNPNDPTPGQEFDYHLYWCNNRGAAAATVWLTDTLPVQTTLLGWRPVQPWEQFWTEVSRADGQLVLYAPGLPGNMCSELILRLLLDENAAMGDILSNRSEIDASGDVYTDNNVQTSGEAVAGPPRADLGLDKWFSNGVLVPGGWARFGVNASNRGNLEVQGRITDTLPAGTSYQAGSSTDMNGQPFEPVTVTPGYVVWDLEPLGVGQDFNFSFALNIAGSVTPGGIENCAAIRADEVETALADNSACASETVHPHGPNLRIQKWNNWNNDSQIGYQVQFQNTGDELVDGAWINDTLPDFTTWDGWWKMDFDQNRLIDDPSSSGELSWQFSTLYPGDSGWLYFNANLDDPLARPRWYTNTIEIDQPAGEVTPADNTAQAVLVKGEVDRVEMWLRPDGNSNVWGNAEPGTEVQVTTPVTQVTALADPGCGGCWNIDNAGPLNPGDLVIVEAGAGLLPVEISVPEPFYAEVDSQAETVTGQIGGWEGRRVQTHGFWTGGYRETTAGESGTFIAQYVEIPHGGNGYIRIETEIDYAQVVLHRSMTNLDLTIRSNYGHDWVEGQYPAGYTFWITATNSAGLVKATSSGTTGVIPWWNGESGFSTSQSGWQPRQPDLAPGDSIAMKLDNGRTAQTQIGTIDGEVDGDLDTVSGAIMVPWLSDNLTVHCQVWAENGPPEITMQVPPDGGSYTCDFNEVGWDVLPGQDVAVMYDEPDGDQVINVFQEPAPHLEINKWADGAPGQGGNFVFHIRYQNHGAAPAENTIITDTMTGWLAYITDTLGVDHTGAGGGPIVWNLGTLPPNSQGQFDVFVEVGALAGGTVSNTALINTSNPFDQGEPWEKESTWNGQVQANDTHLNLGKNPWTGDPTPGANFIWGVNVCNYGSTASSEVVLTDTLPISTTLVDWWGQTGGWTERSQDAEELVLSLPSIAGGGCGEVYLRFHLDEDAPVGLNISNTATVAAANDLESEDNTATSWVTVNNPHTNLSVNTGWNWGQLVPSGELRYSIDYRNNGNVAVPGPIYITDTLPEGTSFLSAWRYDKSGQQFPMIPVEATDQYIVWEIDGLENGFGDNFEVVMSMDPAAEPGRLITNTVNISPQENEDTYDDNTSAWTERLNDHGPNLRVRKWGDWHGFGEGHNAWYQVAVENIGDASIAEAVLTDTYPLSMTLDGDPNTDWGRVLEYNNNPEEHQFTARLGDLWPGFRLDFNGGMYIPGGDPVPFGLTLTNHAEITTPPGDVNPADNQTDASLLTGPDLYVEKSLTGGEALPGEVVTYTLRFGNDQPGHTWWWNLTGLTWITDTLPAGMEFVSAEVRFCGPTEWCTITPTITGDQLAWWLWPFKASEWNEIRVAARIPADVDGQDVLTNQVEIASDQPGVDIEADYANNAASHELPIALPYFAVDKDFTSSRVAGTAVSYQIETANLGHMAGTGLVIRDRLPTHVTYVSGGSYNAGTGEITWHLASLGAGATNAMTFSGTLACTAGQPVTNDDYGVASSQEGVSSEGGSAVTFDIIAPTITASFTQSTDEALVGEAVTFTGTGLTDGTALTYTWDFGDGETGSGASAQHAYTQAGTYTVTLTVADGCGFTATAAVEDAVTIRTEAATPTLYLPVIRH